MRLCPSISLELFFDDKSHETNHNIYLLAIKDFLFSSDNVHSIGSTSYINMKIIFKVLFWIFYTNSGKILSMNNESQICVSGHCLGPDYNSLELPTSKDEVNKITMHLEVSSLNLKKKKKILIM